MKKVLLIFLSGLFTSLDTFSQIEIDFPVVTKQDLPEARFSPVRTFNGESLYGYIDGGADLYLEYGFTGVSVSEFAYLKGKYKTEIYKMKSAEAAFGIFSVSRFRCRTRPVIATYTCQNKYQLQICCGHYYISIINESGSNADSSASIMIGKKIIEKITDTSADLTSFLPGIPAEVVRNESCLVKGRLGVVNGASDLEKYFSGLEGFTAVIIKTDRETLVSIRFDNNEALKKFGVLHSLETDKLSGTAYKMKDGESVRKLYNNHLIIEIPSSN